MNMSYCRFENTVNDMADCIEELELNGWDFEKIRADATSESESMAVLRFLEECHRVAGQIDYEEIDWSPLD